MNPLKKTKKLDVIQWMISTFSWAELAFLSKAYGCESVVDAAALTPVKHEDNAKMAQKTSILLRMVFPSLETHKE